MRRRFALTLVGPVMAAVPAVSNATVTFTVTLDTSTSTLKYGPVNGTMKSLPQGTSISVSGFNGAYFNTATDTAYIPAGDGMVYGYDGSMTGPDAAASAGISAFAFFVNNSSPSVAVPYGGTTKAAPIFNGANTPVWNPALTAANTNGEISPAAMQSSGTGGVGRAPIPTGTFSVRNLNAAGLPSNYAPVGGAVSALLVSNLEFDLLSTTQGASTTITLSNTGPVNFGGLDDYLVGSPGNFAAAELLAGTDAVSVAGATLTIAVATPHPYVPPPPNRHPIIGLASSAVALGGSYGSQLGATLNMAGRNGSYRPAFTGLIDPPQATGYAAASGFNPVTDTEVYALQLNYAGGAITPSNRTMIAAIISDINNGTGQGTSAINVSAGAIYGVYATLFPTYDILLTSIGSFAAGAGGVADLGIDFSQDTDAATPGLVVTNIAAVPEPVGAASLALGSAGLLLGRRKRRSVIRECRCSGTSILASSL